MPKPRIAILATSLVPPHPAGTQILEVVNSLSEEFEFTVFAREIDDKLHGKVRFEKVPIPLCKPLVLRYLVQYFLYERLFQRKQLLKQYDVVHCIEATSPYATLVTMHFSGNAAKDLVKSGTMEYKGWRKFYYPLLNAIGTRMERRLVQNPYLKNIVVVSKGLKKNVHTYYPNLPDKKVKVIYNYADLDRYTDAKKFRFEIRRQYGLDEGDLVGVIVALGDWQRKGLDLAIEAVAKINNCKIRIFVVGGGPIAMYKKICSDRQVSSNFLFVGFQRDLEKFYGAADFLIFPSAFEAFSLVLLEAAAAGLPILATKIDGTEELVEDGFNGIFFERTSDAIAAKLALVYENRGLLESMSKNALTRTNVYTRENMVNEYRMFYNKIIAAEQVAHSS